ncbi:hypothetical protein PspLS_02133 [Pyricularia sp. CBS 133598]|nr:hypothetical protein PspLS_02133 [Pyricularia sp. CBS 133598]
MKNWRLETAVWIRQCHRSTNPDAAANVNWYYSTFLREWRRSAGVSTLPRIPDSTKISNEARLGSLTMRPKKMPKK